MKNLLMVIVIIVSLVWMGSNYIPSVQRAIVNPPSITEVLDHKTEIQKKKAHVYVQYASYRDIKGASWFVKKYSSKFKNLEIKKTSGKNGVWYIVLSEEASKAEADTKCASLKASNIDCLVVSF